MTTIWYQRSGRDHDTHRGTLCRSRVQAGCGIAFATSGTVLPGDPPDPHRICLRCGLGLDEHNEWLALLRVRAGAISKLGEVYVYQGRPFPAVSLSTLLCTDWPPQAWSRAPSRIGQWCRSPRPGRPGTRRWTNASGPALISPKDPAGRRLSPAPPSRSRRPTGFNSSVSAPDVQARSTP